MSAGSRPNMAPAAGLARTICPARSLTISPSTVASKMPRCCCSLSLSSTSLASSALCVRAWARSWRRTRKYSSSAMVTCEATCHSVTASSRSSAPGTNTAISQ